MGEKFNVMKFAGMLLGMLGAMLWAAEGMLVKKAIDKSKKNPLVNQELLIIRSFSSFTVAFLVLLPLGFIPFNDKHLNPFNMMGKILSD